MAIAHVAGAPVVWEAKHMRQRSAWCGTILVDADLPSLTIGEAPRNAWPPMHWVAVEPDGTIRMLESWEPTDDGAPEDACMRLPLELTGMDAADIFKPHEGTS